MLRAWQTEPGVVEWRMSRRYSTLALPRRRHVPGTGTAPDRPCLDTVTAAVAPRLRGEEMLQDPAFRFGADLLNCGFFWEAHEVWEPVWQALAPNSRERIACRALIQGANALLKRHQGQDRAFARLAREVAALAREAGVGGGEPVPGLAEWAGRIESLDPGEEPPTLAF
jgi:hypothetical protein